MNITSSTHTTSPASNISRLFAVDFAWMVSFVVVLHALWRLCLDLVISWQSTLMEGRLAFVVAYWMALGFLVSSLEMGWLVVRRPAAGLFLLAHSRGWIARSSGSYMADHAIVESSYCPPKVIAYKSN